MNIGMETGPNGNGYPPGFPPEFWGLARSKTPEGFSTHLVAGIGTTAMGALGLMKAGIAIPIVVGADLTSRLR